MDLLVLPEDPAFPLEDAPFVCDDDWDCGTFITYPRRTRQMHWIPDRVQTTFSEYSPVVAYDWRAGAEKREDTFQTWLFFGLMAEFLALNEREDGSRAVDLETARQEMGQLMRDCLRYEGDSKILTGKPFLQLRDKVSDRFRQEGSEMTARARRLSRCLNLTRAMMRFADMGLRDPVRYSVAALGQLLVYMLRNLCRTVGLNIFLEDGFWGSWATRLTYAETPLWDQMIRAGWCPGDLERFKQEFGYFSAMQYASRLKLPPSRYSHEACSPTGCTAAQIRPSTYELRHVEDGCTCGTSGVDQSKIIDILSGGDDAYPVLRFVTGASSSLVDVVVERQRPDVPFVSISHVWADGLGNPSANVLQSCQLLKLANLVNSLQKDIGDSTQGGFRIWLDTLCCPIAAVAKKAALERMSSVYRDAAHVLVLDSALENYRFDRLVGPEKYLRLFATSSWVKRLWTLQEGALARSLFFQFADRAVDVSEMTKSVLDHDSYDDLGSLCQNARELFDGMQMRTSIDPGNPATDRPLLVRQLYQLENGIRYRSVSVPSDEALCISTLLELDPRRVLAFDHPEDRMRMVWRLASDVSGGFPADSIFFMGHDTLGAPGWRWAPRSLLRSGSDATWSLPDRLEGFRSPQMGTIVPQGLEVCFPGWLVRLRAWTPVLRTNVWEHLAFRPRYPMIVRDASSGRLMQMSIDFLGHPKTLPDMNIRHILGSPGKFSILRSSGLPVRRHLLARIHDSHVDMHTAQGATPLPIQFMAHISLNALPDIAQIFFENVIDLAKRAASHESSINLSESYSRDESINTEASEKVREYMKQIAAQRLDENEELRQIALRFLDKGESPETFWEAIPITCPFEMDMQSVSDDQRWIID